MWPRAPCLTGLQVTHLLVAASALYQPVNMLPRMLIHVIISSTSFKVQVPGAQGLGPFPFPSVFPPLVISVSIEAGDVTCAPANPGEDAWMHTHARAHTQTYTHAQAHTHSQVFTSNCLLYVPSRCTKFNVSKVNSRFSPKPTDPPAVAVNSILPVAPVTESGRLRESVLFSHPIGQ